MTLRAAVSLTLGTQRFDTHAARASVQLALLPAVDSAELTLPPGLAISASPGDDATLALDGGEGSQEVLVGRVRSLRRTLRGTRVALAGAGAELAALRPAQTFDRSDASEVIEALAGDAGVDVGSVSLTLPLAAYVAHPRRSAAEHVAALARLGGAVAYCDAGGALQVALGPVPVPGVALRYGRELLAYEATDHRLPAAEPVAIGHGPAGAVQAPDALRPTRDALPGGAPAPGPGAVWEAQPILKTPTTAALAGQALATLQAARAQTLRARCFLLPALRPGDVLTVAELPDDTAGGPWLLTRVEHRLDPAGGARTLLWGRSAGAGGGLGGLL